MNTSSHLRPAFSSTSGPHVRTCDGQAFQTFTTLADRLLVSAHTSAEACFAAWTQTTFAERAAAAKAAALRQARPSIMETDTAQPCPTVRRCGYPRLLAFLTRPRFVSKKTAPAGSDPATN